MPQPLAQAKQFTSSSALHERSSSWGARPTRLDETAAHPLDAAAVAQALGRR